MTDSSSTPTPTPRRSAFAARLSNVLSDSTRNGWLLEDLAQLSDEHSLFLGRDWDVWARDDQLPPGVDAAAAAWRVWVILGGRGAGKTRAGAEWVRAKALGLLPGCGTEPAASAGNAAVPLFTTTSAQPRAGRATAV